MAPGPIAHSISKDDIQKLVDEAIKVKIAEYRRLLYAFLAGLCLLLTALLGDKWWNDGKLIDALRERTIAFEIHVSRLLGKTVAFSYANEYWLDSTTGQKSLAFYANRAQSVEALIQVLHQGTGEKLPVSLRLDHRPDPLWRSTEDLTWGRIELTDKLRATGEVSVVGPANVHYLVFTAEHPTQSTDRVFIRVLLNVVGLEKQD